MPKFIRNSMKKLGLAPGSVVYVGKQNESQSKIDIITYNEETFVEKKNISIKTITKEKGENISWINITGLNNVQGIQKIGEIFGLNNLVLEDIVNTNQRPFFEDYEDYLFMVIKMFYYNEKKDEMTIEHVSLIVTSSHVITFQELPDDVFNSVRNRIKAENARIRKRKGDYLGYALIDAIIDNYFVVIEKMGDRIEELEEKIGENPTQETLQDIYRLKRDLIFLRKNVWPLRECISRFQKSESKIIEDSTGMFLRDLYDHTIQAIDTIESYREMVSGLNDIYLSTVSNKMNEVMKILTIFAAIFIPLTFFAGIYGMNFEYIPELSWRYGYAFVWGLFLLVGGGMLFLFKSKKWL